MNSRRVHGPALFLGALLLTVTLFNACDSPLDVETPRNRYSEQVSVLPGEDIGTAVSVVLPPDTSGNGGEWTPAHFSAAMVFDASGSITAQQNQYFKSAGNTFLDSLDGDVDEGAVLYFTQTTTVLQGITSNVALLRTAVNKLPVTPGATAMWDGVYDAMLQIQGSSTQMRKAVIVITDSEDFDSKRASPSTIIDIGERNDIKVFTIVMGYTSNEQSLRAIAESTGGKHYLRPLLSELGRIMKEIASILRKPQ